MTAINFLIIRKAILNLLSYNAVRELRKKLKKPLKVCNSKIDKKKIVFKK